MFTLEQINDIHERLGEQATLPQYLQALKSIGVYQYDSFIMDGHSEYYGNHGQKLVSPPVHEHIAIAKTTNRESFLNQLTLHNEGKTNYLELSTGLANSGIEKWTFDTHKMTLTYYDIDGREMLVEEIR